MPFHEEQDIRYFTFESLGILNAIFTRRGGVSPAPWQSLNVGGTVGDDLTHVRENRLRSFAALRRDPVSIHDVWLVHGTDVVHADTSRDLAQPPPKADILTTNNPAVTLFMRYADCVPLILHDPVKQALCIAHAGWLGTVRGVATAAVQAMQIRYGSSPNDLRAAIGPSIGPDHYEIGADVAGEIHKALGVRAHEVLEARNDKHHLDLWAANRIQLEQAGVVQVEVAAICTACHTDDWFSHRAEKGKTGRFGALVALS